MTQHAPEPVYTATPEPIYQPPRDDKGKGCMWAAIGCGSFLLIGFIFLGVAGWYVARNAKTFAADWSVVMTEEALKESGMPEPQREQVIARVRRVAEGFKSGDVTVEDLQKFGEKIAEDKSMVAAGLLYFIETHLLNSSKLDDEQRERAERALQRVARGVVEEKIELKSLESVVDGFLEPPGSDGNRKVKDNLTPEEVDEIIADATELADSAEVPDEPYEIDVAEHIDTIIDEVMGIPPVEPDDVGAQVIEDDVADDVGDVTREAPAESNDVDVDENAAAGSAG